MKTQHCSATPNPDVIRAWADMYGMPESYTSVDIETSGLDHERDHILQIGWCKVTNKKATENAGVIIDCISSMSVVELDIFKHRLQHTEGKMAERGAAYGWTAEKLAKGKPPKEAFNKFIEVCNSNDYILSYCGIKFDYRVLDRFCERYSNVRLPPLDSGKLLDSHVIYRASIACIYPRPGESYASATGRVLAAKVFARQSCTMQDCLNQLKLTAEGAVCKRAHDAIYDSWLAHIVYEKLREIAK